MFKGNLFIKRHSDICGTGTIFEEGDGESPQDVFAKISSHLLRGHAENMSEKSMRGVLCDGSSDTYLARAANICHAIFLHFNSRPAIELIDEISAWDECGDLDLGDEFSHLGLSSLDWLQARDSARKTKCGTKWTSNKALCKRIAWPVNPCYDLG